MSEELLKIFVGYLHPLLERLGLSKYENLITVGNILGIVGATTTIYKFYTIINNYLEKRSIEFLSSYFRSYSETISHFISPSYKIEYLPTNPNQNYANLLDSKTFTSRLLDKLPLVNRYSTNFELRLIELFMKRILEKPSDSPQFYIIESDTGMGKTSLLVNLYAKYKTKLKTAHPEIGLFSLSDQIDIPKLYTNKEFKTVLLLDGLDENREFIKALQINEKAACDYIENIFQKYMSFSKVIITIRSQVLLTKIRQGLVQSNDNANITKYVWILIQPFSYKDSEDYIKKRYPLYNLFSTSYMHRYKALTLLKSMQKTSKGSVEAIHRPLLLNFIYSLTQNYYKISYRALYRLDDAEHYRIPIKDGVGSIFLNKDTITQYIANKANLNNDPEWNQKIKGKVDKYFQTDFLNNSIYLLYEKIVFLWSVEETKKLGKPNYHENLIEACAYIALEMSYQDKHFLEETELQEIEKKYSIHLDDLELRVRSLLTRILNDGPKGKNLYTFMHLSFKEYFLAYCLFYKEDYSKKIYTTKGYSTKEKISRIQYLYNLEKELYKNKEGFFYRFYYEMCLENKAIDSVLWSKTITGIKGKDISTPILLEDFAKIQFAQFTLEGFDLRNLFPFTNLTQAIVKKGAWQKEVENPYITFLDSKEPVFSLQEIAPIQLKEISGFCFSKKLNLTGLNLDNLDSFICQFPFIESLDVSQNSISELDWLLQLDWSKEGLEVLLDYNPIPLENLITFLKKDIPSILSKKLVNLRVKNSKEIEERYDTPLLYFSYQLKKDSLVFLLEKGADAKLASSIDGSTPLMACMRLVSFGFFVGTLPEPNPKPSNQLEEFYLSEFKEHYPTWLDYWKVESNVYKVVFGNPSQRTYFETDKEEYCNLFLSDSFAIFEKLVAQSDVNAKNNNGWTALMIASENGHLSIVESLIDKGADVKAKTTDGSTALMFASQNGHVSIVEFLIDKGADVKAIANDGGTALMLASQNGHLSIVESLIDKGADVKAKTTDGSTALMLASQNGHLSIVESLIKNKADVNAVTNDTNGNWTALKIASNHGHLSIVKFLIDKGAAVKAIDNDGWTALMVASQNGHLTIVESLIDKGADVNAINKGGSTALKIARSNDAETFVLSALETRCNKLTEEEKTRIDVLAEQKMQKQGNANTIENTDTPISYEQKKEFIIIMVKKYYKEFQQYQKDSEAIVKLLSKKWDTL